MSSAFFFYRPLSDKIFAMQAKTMLLSLAGALIGFAIGFAVANSINRTELEKLRAEVDFVKAAKTQGTTDADLSADEIRSKIAEADANPNNIAFQKNLGLALYKYGSIKNDSAIISEAARLLERASKLSEKDPEISIGLANAWFDIGYLNKDNSALKKARERYQSELAKSPDDAGVITDLGMTYFLEDPPDDSEAIKWFKLALSKDPKNEKALQFIVQSLTRNGDKTAAATYLQKLREAYPSDESIEGLAENVNSSASKDLK